MFALKHTAVVCLSALLLSCQTGMPTANTAQLISKLEGTYSNAAQYAAADDALKITPKIGDTRPWIDRKHAVFKRVENSALPGDVIALEWRNDNAAGDISRQRLWAFRQESGKVLMDFYSLKSPVDFSDMAALAALSENDLISYGEKCALPLRKVMDEYHFSIPGTCRITSRSGRDMILSADIIIRQDLRYREGGKLADGAPIFEVPGSGIYYRFDRSEP